MTDKTDSPHQLATSAYPVALDLGWEMAELHSDPHTKRSFSQTEETASGNEAEQDAGLRTLSDLERWEQSQISLASIRVALHRLGPAIAAAGLESPAADAAMEAFQAGENDKLKEAIRRLHDELVCCLHAADDNLGKAYDLGRSLAYTCRRPKSWEGVREEFQRWRLATLTGWLADLSSYLPDHSSRAVAISMGIWQEAIPDPGKRMCEGQVAGDLDQVTRQQMMRQLHRQAKLWRAVLTGAKSGRQMLQAKDYVAAVGRLCRRAIHLLFSPRTYFLAPLILAAGGVAIGFILSSGATEINKIIGAIAAGAGALGITWTGVKATLGRLVADVEEPLWGAELDVAIGGAMTTLDRGWLVRFHQRPSRIASAVTPPRGPAAE